MEEVEEREDAEGDELLDVRRLTGILLVGIHHIGVDSCGSVAVHASDGHGS